MIKSRIAVAGALLAAAGAANAAGLTVTPTIATDYDFRGLSQTDWNADRGDVLPFAPAFQLGATYTFDSGLYASIWGSNVAFFDGGEGGKAAKPDFEIDYTLGFAGGDAAESFGYDFGVTLYSYPSAGSLNTFEAYAGISKGMFSGKLWYSPDYFSSDESGYYLEGNAAVPMPMDFTLLGHVGISDGDFYSDSVTDYSIGVGKSFGKFATNLKWVDGTDHYDGRLVLAVSTTLPWSE